MSAVPAGYLGDIIIVFFKASVPPIQPHTGKWLWLFFQSYYVVHFCRCH